MGEGGAANLNCRRAGHEEFKRVCGAGDAAHSHNGDLRSQCRRKIPHHAQGNGFNGRAGQSRSNIVKNRFAFFYIYCQCLEGINQRKGIGANINTGAGYFD